MSFLFAETLRKLRTAKGLSQQDLAERMFVTRTAVVRWETGRRLPDIPMLSRLSNVLGEDFYMLLDAASQSDDYPNVIVVDDMKLELSGELPVLEEVLPNATITGFTQPAEAIEFAKANRIALAFLDIELRNFSGLKLCRELLAINPRTNIVFLTAHIEYSYDAWGTGASGFMLKPLTPEGTREQLKNLRYPFWSGSTNL